MQIAILAFLVGAIFQAPVLDAALSPTTAISVPNSPTTFKLAAPRILLIDRTKLTNAGLLADPNKLSGMEGAVLNEEMQKYGANLLLDRSVVLSGGDGLDFSDDVIEEVAPNRGLSKSSRGPLVSAPTSPIRILIFDQAAITATSSAGEIANARSSKIIALLNQIRKERDADFVIARSAVVLEAPELNITPAMHNLMNDGSNSDASNVSASGAMLQVSDAKIMTIDRYMLIPQSKVGRSVSSQVDGYTRAAHTEFGGEQNALLARRSELVREQAAQPSGAVTEKIKQFEQDRDVYEQKIHVREKQLQQGAERARGQIERALEPILRRIMAAHGANILLDQAVVPKASAEFDLTAEAIIMLDAELPTVPVSLPPAEQ